MSGNTPVFSSNPHLTIEENTTFVDTVAGFDLEGDTLTFSISGGVDKAKFKIDSTTGVLTLIAGQDYEVPTDAGGDHVFDVIIKISDGTTSVTQAMTVSIGDVLSATIEGTSGGDIISTGAASSTLRSSNEGDTINGLAGNDTINGGGGADSMFGGEGDDRYFVDNLGDVVTEDAGEFGGVDRVTSSVSFTLADYVENLELAGTAAINGTGNGSANIILGNAGANIIDGGAGIDSMAGGLGNDTYIVDDENDVIFEAVSGGTDLVKSSAGNYTLSGNIEKLTLLDGAISGWGNASANTIIGNAADNTLIGLDGNDTIDGGAGADYMEGGIGDDTYVVDDINDNVGEYFGQGKDSVSSGVSYSLQFATNIENVTLTGVGAINATGNNGTNVLTGNSAANVLYGLTGADTINGGAGADSMYGGGGADVYYVDNIGDYISEANVTGVDLVYTKVSLSLVANLENAVLQGSAGFNLTGNTSNNSLIGNSGDNTLVGNDGNDVLKGMTGADTMIGGLGDDTYFVNQAGDSVIEVDGQGTDTVNSDVTFDLGTALENLTLTGTDLADGTGNESVNIMTGNYNKNVLTSFGGNDILDGKEGADTMIGGAGNDTYYVQSTGDVITEDANAGSDTVVSTLTTYTLGSDLENLTLGGTYNIAGTGNELGNIMTGNKGNNSLFGGAGFDHIDGGAGNDKLYGGAGLDNLTGGAGFDKFMYLDASDSGLSDGSNDWIFDFAQGDKIDVSALDANADIDLDQAFKLDGDASFSQGEISVTQDGADVWLAFNMNSDSAVEMTIRLKNALVADITSIDFVL